MTTLPIDPVLSRSQSLAFEKEFFKGDEEREWQVMNQAGEAIAESMRFDLGDFRSPERGGACSFWWARDTTEETR